MAYLHIIPRYETSCRRLDRVRMKERIPPTRQNRIVQAAWSVSVFIIIEKVKICAPIRNMKKII